MTFPHVTEVTEQDKTKQKMLVYACLHACVCVKNTEFLLTEARSDTKNA